MRTNTHPQKVQTDGLTHRKLTHLVGGEQYIQTVPVITVGSGLALLFPLLYSFGGSWDSY